ncbi:MAG: Ig-like domain-containing protein, partial [Clostridia bacterium]|nr:Ig-like domain-containing protein [Clostridia bacterium]
GWSAQAYINVVDINKISVGGTFTVEAETNDSGVRWTSSDSSVASIDANTGKITAHRKGVVLITVGSDSGLDDSCLVMIE